MHYVFFETSLKVERWLPEEACGGSDQAEDNEEEHSAAEWRYLGHVDDIHRTGIWTWNFVRGMVFAHAENR